LTFPFGCEQALGGEHSAKTLDPSEQLTQADRPDLVRGQRQGSAGVVPRRLGMNHDARAFDDWWLHQLENLMRAGDL
jgi:hypothetical protein